MPNSSFDTFNKGRMMRLEEKSSQHDIRIDRAAGEIRGVKVLGTASRNGRVYPESTLRAAASLYAGVAVNVDHNETSLGGRGVGDQFGRLESVAFSEGALRGNLQYLKSHPLAEQILETAERFPGRLGLSHAAEGNTKPDGHGGAIVSSITEVHSVDLVTNPASTSGLFESSGGGGVTLEDFKAGILSPHYPGGGYYGQLREGVDVDEDPDASDAKVREGFAAAIRAAVDDQSLNLAATMKKIRKILKAQESVLGSVGELPDDTDDTDTDDVLSDRPELAIGESLLFGSSAEQLAEFQYHIITH